VASLGCPPADRIALRLLHYGLRKGALKAVQHKHFDYPRRRLTTGDSQGLKATTGIEPVKRSARLFPEGTRYGDRATRHSAGKHGKSLDGPADRIPADGHERNGTSATTRAVYMTPFWRPATLSWSTGGFRTLGAVFARASGETVMGRRPIAARLAPSATTPKAGRVPPASVITGAARRRSRV
jgi:hypothetical protein